MAGPVAGETALPRASPLAGLPRSSCRQFVGFVSSFSGGAAWFFFSSCRCDSDVSPDDPPWSRSVTPSPRPPSVRAGCTPERERRRPRAPGCPSPAARAPGLPSLSGRVHPGSHLGRGGLGAFLSLFFGRFLPPVQSPLSTSGSGPGSGCRSHRVSFGALCLWDSRPIRTRGRSSPARPFPGPVAPGPGPSPPLPQAAWASSHLLLPLPAFVPAFLRLLKRGSQAPRGSVLGQTEAVVYLPAPRPPASLSAPTCGESWHV